MDTTSMGKKISELRKREGWTQQEFADKIGVSDKTISKWELDNGYPEISMIPIIAKTFHVTTDYLFNMESSENIVQKNNFKGDCIMYKYRNRLQSIKIVSGITGDYRVEERGFRCYNSNNENIGIVFEQTDPRTPHLGCAEIRYFPEFKEDYGKYHRFKVVNGKFVERLDWRKLCNILSSQDSIEFDTI